MKPTDRSAIRFAEKVLALLDDGQFTATYKYAVLLGLLDLSLEKVGRRGEPPQVLTTRQLADKVIDLYWAHALPFGRGSEGRVLRQNRGRAGSRAEIVRRVREFRTSMAAEHATGSLVQLRRLAPGAFAGLRHHVEWKLIQMPLPRVQVVGNVHDPFLYEIGWDTGIRRAEVRAYQEDRPSTFDNRIRLGPGVGTYLVHLNGLLRPLIHRQWARMVARLNGLEEARLERFLFGTTRNPLGQVRPGLAELQSGACFYCRGPVRQAGQVDHFIPWSRYPDDGLANLVLAHERCNRAKRDFLAATPHVARWAERLEGSGLEALEEEIGWSTSTPEILGVARGVYLRLPEDSVLWLEGRDFTTPDPAELGRVLG